MVQYIVYIETLEKGLEIEKTKGWIKDFWIEYFFFIFSIYDLLFFLIRDLFQKLTKTI